MADAQGGNTSGGLHEVFFFVILAAILIFGMWFALRGPIMWLSFYLSYYCFTVYEHLSWLMTSAELKELIAARHAIPRLKPTEFGIGSLMQLFEYHGYVWRWVFIPAMIWLGWRTKKSVVRFGFNRQITDVYKLIDIQAKHFPASAIIKGKNLLCTHPYVGPWATFCLPLDFALDNQLLWASKKVIKADERVDEETMMPLPAFTPNQKLQPFPVKRKLLPAHDYVQLHIYKTADVFAKQLGPLWRGPEHLPPLERALYAAFCAQASGEQGKAWAMIEQLAFSFKEGTHDKDGKLVTPHYADTKGTDELLKLYGNAPVIKTIHGKHAHSTNVMVATLKAARSKGRLMHSNFLWVKPVNRTLWYALCGQGGQSAYWEAAGCWAHAQIESLMSKKLITPYVAGAVDAFRELMSREHWIDPGEHSEEAQQRLVTEANAKLQAEQDRVQSSKQRGAGMLGGAGSYRQNQAQRPASKQRKEDDAP